LKTFGTTPPRIWTASEAKAKVKPSLLACTFPIAGKAAIPSSRNAIHSLNFDGDVGGGWAAVNWWGTVFLFSFFFFSNLINF
jgi:hypothetical protein